MATHRDEHDQSKKTPRPEPKPESAEDAAGTTMRLSKKAPPPMPKKTPPVTQLAGKEGESASDASDVSLGEGQPGRADGESSPGSSVVLGDEPRKTTSDSSSVVEAMVIDSGVDLAEAGFGSNVTPGEGDSVVDLGGKVPAKPSSSSSSIFADDSGIKGADSAHQGKESLAQKEEALEEILASVQASGHEHVLGTGELKGPGSSALSWEQVMEATPSKPVKHSDAVEETVAFDIKSEKPSDAVGGDSDVLLRKKGSGVDLLAEALESGVNLDSGVRKVGEATEIENLDDLLPPDSGARRKDDATELDAGAVRDQDAETMLTEDGLRKQEGGKQASVVFDEETFRDDSAAKAARKTARSGGDALFVARDEDRKHVPPGAKGGVLTGALIGIALVVLAVAGVWLLAPRMLGDMAKSSPNFKEEGPRNVPPPPVSLTQKARDKIQDGQYVEAIAMLEGAKEPAELAIRGEARWWKHLNEHGDKKLEPNDPEISKALDDLTRAEAKVLLTQIQRSLELTKNLDDVKTAEATARKALTEAQASKKASDEALDGIADVLVRHKLLNDKQNLKVAEFEKLVKETADTKAQLAATNKLLEEAKVKDLGAKGVEAVLAARNDFENKLDALNKSLADAKVKEGAKGVTELVEARNKLTKERDELDQAVKSAFKELADSKLVPEGADPKSKLIEGIKAARAQSESPLSVPLDRLATALGSLGTGAGGLIQKGFDATALMAELNYYRLREPLFGSPEKKVEVQAASPFLAEQFFGKGQHYYKESRYREAEQQFQQAIKHFADDARYQYFLGLARLAQNNDLASRNFAEGARLEAANRPSPLEVNRSLERVQGEARRTIDQYRHKAEEPGGE